MAVNPMYAKGFNAGVDYGYQKGVQSGLKGSAARTIMEKDLIHIYGEMAIVLIEKHHWKQQSVENLIAEIQTAWRNLVAENMDDNSNYESMAELVERRTGISLRQMVQDTLDGGWDE